jgi:hypothetical protein
MASVADVTTRPMPSPRRMNGGHRWRYDESTCRVRSESRATDEASRPAVMGNHGPNRLVSLAPTGPEKAKVTVRGSSRSPAPTGLNPWTLCRYSEMKNSTPNRAKKLKRTMIVLNEMARSRKMRSGTSGSRTTLSTATNATRRTSPAAITPRVRALPQPQLWALIRP